MNEALGSLTWGEYLAIGGFVVTVLGVVVPIVTFVIGRRRGAKALKLQQSQESGQKEKRAQLVKGLRLIRERLDERSSYLYVHRVDTSPGNVAKELEELGAGLPDVDELRDVAAELNDDELRQRVSGGLEAAAAWRFEAEAAWRKVKNAPVWCHDSKDKYDEVYYDFSITRYSLLLRASEFNDIIFAAIRAIEAVGRGEDLAVPPGDNVLRRTARRVGAYLTRLGSFG